jgi:MoaA/NifB/PqqE/SkfB family radical SAM enzyme
MKDHNTSTFKKVIAYDLTKRPHLNDWEDNTQWWDDFNLIIPFLDRIEFAGGEPLIDPIHYRILNLLKPYANNIELKYSTNLTNLSYKKEDVLQLWENFKSIDITISIDGVGDIYNYIRQAGDYNDIKRNINVIKKHPKVKRIAGACTIQIYNVFNIPELIDEFNELGVRLHTHRVNYPEFLDVRVLPSQIKDEIITSLNNYLAIGNQSEHNKHHITDIIHTLLGGDLSHLLDKFVEFSDSLDREQNVDKSWRELLPLLSTYVKEHT